VLLWKPGLCGPSSATFRNAAIRAPAPAGAKQHPGAGLDAAVSGLPVGDVVRRQQKSGSASDFGRHIDDARRSDETSAGMVSQAFSGKSLPVIQCTGASKCVPVCSPIRMVFQYQAGPLSSKREMTSRSIRRVKREHRRQADDRRLGTERLREIHDPQRAGVQQVTRSVTGTPA
jgi:hypothetical protein